MSSESASPKALALSFWEHMDELVRRLKVVLVTLIITIGIGWIPTNLAGIANPVGNYQPLLALVMVRLREVFLPKQATLIAGGMADTIFVMAYLSVIIGLLLAAPVIFYEVVAFVKPALYDHEKRVIGYYLGSFTGLLVLGAVMAYFLIIPISFRILVYFTIQGGASALILIKDFYNWIYTIFLVCGVFYTIPVFVVMLVQVGVLPMKFLRGRNKLFAYLILLMLFWIFGPDPTPVTGAIMLVPFVVVFEIATCCAGRMDKSRTKRRNGETSGKPKGGLISFPRETCKFCNSPIAQDAAFCPECHRATK
jgi:sec-independent protein translocase protein TatC